ncbi:SEC-C domain-containing protein [Shewanella sp. VB17]|uniref:YchJ family protein n=1 Tax=Shewanella sp. VB17 TaxID=2739432 RepID=UPI0015653224|nr:YchJ family metal-binding protein [Shewanella sp. VB17]NRD73676.1 SEC-C domain-containing protein [Shewanella sp. VB17]
MMTHLDEPCPCSQNNSHTFVSYSECCAPYHQANSTPITPEQLMRSRYTAFVMKQYDYLIQTHHPAFLNTLTAEVLAENDALQWLSLQIMSHHMQAYSGEVCFQAWYRDANGINAIHECSQFICENGLWLYTQGKQKAAVYPKRNETCLCHSGKKYKQCCLK